MGDGCGGGRGRRLRAPVGRQGFEQQVILITISLLSLK